MDRKPHHIRTRHPQRTHLRGHGHCGQQGLTDGHIVIIGHGCQHIAYPSRGNTALARQCPTCTAASGPASPRPACVTDLFCASSTDPSMQGCRHYHCLHRLHRPPPQVSLWASSLLSPLQVIQVPHSPGAPSAVLGARGPHPHTQSCSAPYRASVVEMFTCRCQPLKSDWS